MPYNQGYSGGSVGPVFIVTFITGSMFTRKKPTLEHVEHALGDHEASSNVDTSEEDRQGTQNLWYSAREVTTSHYEKPTDTDQPYKTTTVNNGVTWVLVNAYQR